jgi:hypothetical protein
MMGMEKRTPQKGWTTMDRNSHFIGLAHGDFELPMTRTELVRQPNGFFTSVFGGWGVRI